MALTFDLSAAQAAAQARAREVAAGVSASAAGIDQTGTVPAGVRDAVASLDLWAGADPVATLLMVEELAAASPSAAAAAALDIDGAAADLAGLRGVPRVTTPEDRHYLAMAAVCVGIGRAALSEAIRVARARGDRPAGDPADPPHWALADAATEIDGARLLLLAAAAGDGASAAAAMVHAAGAADRAVDAALRVVGPGAYRPGSAIERLSRDARAARLILGSEDGARRAAADALLT